MVKKETLPRDYFVLDERSSAVQSMVFKQFKSEGIPIHEDFGIPGTQYPYVCWNGSLLTQTVSAVNEVCVPLDEFLRKFFHVRRMFTVAGVEVYVEDGNSISMGSHKVDFETVEDIYLEMKFLRDANL